MRLQPLTVLVGLIPADPETWSVRRRQIVPAFHKVRASVSLCFLLDSTSAGCSRFQICDRLG